MSDHPTRRDRPAVKGLTQGLNKGESAQRLQQAVSRARTTSALQPAPVQRTLVVRLQNRQQWLELSSSATAVNTIFCPTDDQPLIGTSVQLEISFSTGPRAVLNGVVISRRHAGSGRLKAGVGVFVQADCRTALAFVNAWARGQTNDRRDARRLPARLIVSYGADGKRRINFTRDLSAGGLFVQATHALEVGRSVDLRLTAADGKEHLNLRGVVAHHGAKAGMGLRLVFATNSERTRYLDFLAPIERAYLDGELTAADRSGCLGAAAASSPSRAAAAQR